MYPDTLYLYPHVTDYQIMRLHNWYDVRIKSIIVYTNWKSPTNLGIQSHTCHLIQTD